MSKQTLTYWAKQNLGEKYHGTSGSRNKFMLSTLGNIHQLVEGGVHVAVYTPISL